MYDINNITAENVPFVLGIIVTKLENIEHEQSEIKTVLKDHTDCLEIFKLSKCKIMPWLGRNKYIVSIMFVLFSAWLSIINFSSDWVARILQWGNLLP